MSSIEQSGERGSPLGVDGVARLDVVPRQNELEWCQITDAIAVNVVVQSGLEKLWRQPQGEGDSMTSSTMPDHNVPRRTFLKLAGLGAAGAALNQTMPAASNGRKAPDLPDYAPVPKSALGPALNAQGYYVGRVEKNLYWVTDGTYQSAFLTTKDGVVLLDAPPTIGHNIQRAVDEIAKANGVSNKVKYLIYSHHHADHGGASSLFGKDIVRIGHEETRKLLIRDNDKARPAPEEIFQDKRTLNIGGSRIELAWRGSNHSPDNIYIHLPDHDALMLVDIVNPGWAPIYICNLTEDVPGYMAAPEKALVYKWTHFIGGHCGRLGTRADVSLHQQYMTDIADSIRKTLPTVDPTPYFTKYRENNWGGVKAYLDACTDAAAAPVVKKYTGVIAAADVFTDSTTFWVMESLRLDLGFASWVHP